MTYLQPVEKKGTDLDSFLDSLDGGCLKTKLEACLNDIAMAVDHTQGAGTLTLKLDIKSRKGRSAVDIKHSITSKKPTMRGDQTATDSEKTPMYVGKHGRVTLFEENQDDMFAEETLRKQAEARQAMREQGDEASIVNDSLNSMLDNL